MIPSQPPNALRMPLKHFMLFNKDLCKRTCGEGPVNHDLCVGTGVERPVCTSKELGATS